MKHTKKLASIFLGIVLLLQMVMPVAAVQEIDFDGDPNADIIFYKDENMTERYTSPDDIPMGAKVYYEIVTEPGYICHYLKINVYEVTNNSFVNNYPDGQLEYSLESLLAGDTTRDNKLDLTDAARILRYIAGFTEEYWGLGQSAAGRCRMDYTCDGKVNLLDVTGLLKEVAGHDVEKTTSSPGTYAIQHLLMIEDVMNFSVELEAKYAFSLTRGYNVNSFLGVKNDQEIWDELYSKYTSEELFGYNSLVCYFVKCAGDGAPVLKRLWYTSDRCVLDAEWECSNFQYCAPGEGWLVVFTVDAALKVNADHPV